MSMPPPRFIVIPAGAVIKYWNPPSSPDPPSVIIAATIADIQSFGFTLSEATAIYKAKIDFDPGTVPAAMDKLITDQAIALSTGVVIKARGPGATTKSFSSPVQLAHNTCYWLMPTRKKRSAIKRKTKKRLSAKPTSKKRPSKKRR